MSEKTNALQKNKFKDYLSNVISQRSGKKLSASAITSYLLFIEPQRLFDYNPSKWENITDIYQIQDASQIELIIKKLNSDKDFKSRDKNNNQYYRSGALKHYRNFLARESGQTIDPISDEIESRYMLVQTIFFGAPGIGKSYKVGAILGDERRKCFAESSDIVKSSHYAEVLSNKEYVDCDIWVIDNIRILENKLAEFYSDDKRENPRHSALQAYIEFYKKYRENNRELRTTFHPDYDYAQFVGAYKPKKEGKDITYSFVPQVFAKAYAAAWKLQLTGAAESNVFLVIEEINRGNCAQIFGDIFQLLDRDSEGFSQYSIDADCDFAEWLKEDSILKTIWSEYETKVGDGKLKLPPNLNILATMNTSDQSLFPMDSAFKRRFDWEYVPISFDGKDAANYQIDIDGSQYSWQNFVEAVNDKILDLTESEDKQLGEFFIKPDNGNIISKERFLGKVMFYLWNEVCKDEHKNGSFFRAKINDKEDFFTFQDLYKKKDLLKLFMDELLKKE